jgi:polysaccharide deacetylase family protein (PEP-CTERM system associated)
MFPAPFHLLTIDVEDWPQSTLDHSLPIGSKVVDNTHVLLDFLSEMQVRATFFILGKVAEVYPLLARRIAEAGHDVGTHGYSHESVENMPVARFKDELHRSIEMLRQQTGQPVLGHRAADFSISRNSLHLLEYLSQEGLIYDSSIYPVRHPRYGVSGAWRYPHLIRCVSGRMLVEFPLATIRFARMVIPTGGGGYFRLFPYLLTKLGFRALEQEGSPATCYLHPYELNSSEMRQIPYHIPFLLRWSQGANRGSVIPKLRKLLSEFRFLPMAEACEVLDAGKLKVGLDLQKNPVAYDPHPEGAFSSLS